VGFRVDRSSGSAVSRRLLGSNSHSCRATERARPVKARSRRGRASTSLQARNGYSGLVGELVVAFSDNARSEAWLLSTANALGAGPGGPWALLYLSKELAQRHTKGAGKLVRNIKRKAGFATFDRALKIPGNSCLLGEFLLRESCRES
jgi:hypothetical protein